MDQIEIEFEPRTNDAPPAGEPLEVPDALERWLEQWWESIGQTDPRRVVLAFTIAAVSGLRARGLSDDEIREHAHAAARSAGPRLESIVRQIVNLALQEPAEAEFEGPSDLTLDSAAC